MDEQQLLLWRLSTAVQLVSLAMIAVFFAIFARLNPRAEVTWWARAWFANLLALSLTLVYWYFQPAPLLSFIGPLYLASKIAFVLMLTQGAWSLSRPGARLLSNKVIAALLIGYFVAGLVD